VAPKLLSLVLSTQPAGRIILRCNRALFCYFTVDVEKIFYPKKMKSCKRFYFPSLITDRRYSLFGHICHPGIHLFHKHYIYPLMLSPAHLLPLTGSARRGCPRKTWLQQVEEDSGSTISACQFTNLDRSLWRSLRPTACQAQQ